MKSRIFFHFWKTICFFCFSEGSWCIPGSGTKSLGSWGWCLNVSQWERRECRGPGMFCRTEWRHLSSGLWLIQTGAARVEGSLNPHVLDIPHREHVLLDAQWMDKTLDFEDTGDGRMRWGRYRWRNKLLSLKYSDWWLFLSWEMGVSHIHTPSVLLRLDFYGLFVSQEIYFDIKIDWEKTKCGGQGGRHKRNLIFSQAFLHNYNTNWHAYVWSLPLMWHSPI